MSDNMLKKTKKATIPNVYYVFMAVGFAMLITIIYAVKIVTQSGQMEEVAEPVVQEAPPALARASQFAQKDLKLGMSRSDVIRKLGKPNWAAIPGDEGQLSLPDASFGLELRWSNPACRDVVVMFSPPPHQVIGWDDGASYCKMPIKADYEDFSCELPDRKQFCH